MPISNSCQVLRVVVADVGLIIDHLTQGGIHKALFVKQLSNHSYRFLTQTAFLFQILLLNKPMFCSQKAAGFPNQFMQVHVTQD